jgi:hypothetical protein
VCVCADSARNYGYTETPCTLIVTSADVPIFLFHDGAKYQRV